MDKESGFTRRAFLIGAALSLMQPEVLKDNLEAVNGMLHEHKGIFENDLNAEDLYGFGNQTIRKIFDDFKLDNDLFLGFLPNSPVLPVPADNWSYSRIMASAIGQIQAACAITGQVPEITALLTTTINGIGQYEVKNGKKDMLEYAAWPVSKFETEDPPDTFCDDNAWIGLNFLRIFDLYKDFSMLQKAEKIFHFGISNWQKYLSCDSGGIPWKPQTGGETNHDRNTVSNAPYAMIGFELYKKTKNPYYLDWARKIYDFEMNNLVVDEQVFDHINGNCRKDKTFWSYTAGVVIGMNRLMYQAAGDSSGMGQARDIAYASITAFKKHSLFYEPPEFTAIYFQELLELFGVTEDSGLRREIYRVITDYVRELLNSRNIHRENDLFLFQDNFQLIHQAAVADILYSASALLISCRRSCGF